jgi:hypothetical protein
MCGCASWPSGVSIIRPRWPPISALTVVVVTEIVMYYGSRASAFVILSGVALPIVH